MRLQRDCVRDGIGPGLVPSQIGRERPDRRFEVPQRVLDGNEREVETFTDRQQSILNGRGDASGSSDGHASGRRLGPEPGERVTEQRACQPVGGVDPVHVQQRVLHVGDRGARVTRDGCSLRTKVEVDLLRRRRVIASGLAGR